MDLLTHLRRAADLLGPHNLGYTSDQICLHSAQSGAAMAMYLAGVPVFTIMLLGVGLVMLFYVTLEKKSRNLAILLAQK
jgi:hypothetical protein